MQCQRCGFENMPGLTACVRCGSILAATGAIEVHPPRAGWGKFFRPLGYRLNRFFGFQLPERIGSVLERIIPIRYLASRSPLHMLLSVVPGLGHAAAGSLSAIKWLWPAWAGFLLAGLCFYGTTPGGVLIGVAIAVHAWIVCDAGDVRPLVSHARMRFLFLIGVYVVLFGVLYGGIRDAVSYRWRGAFVGMNLPCDGIQQEDYLIIDMSAYRHTVPQRGEVALYYLPTADVWRGVRFAGGEMVGKILGLPGEKVEFKQDRVVLSRQGRIQASFTTEELGIGPVELTAEIPEGDYYCLHPPFVRHGGGHMPWEHRATLAGLVPERNIRGRAFMIYNPIWRRGFLP